MAPWQTPGTDQLTAKYLIRPFALTQLAWLPRSNRVSCTCTGGWGAIHCLWGDSMGRGQRGAASLCLSCIPTPPQPRVHPRALPASTRVCCAHRRARQQPPPRGCERPSWRGGGSPGSPPGALQPARRPLAREIHLRLGPWRQAPEWCVCPIYGAGGGRGGRAAPQLAGLSRRRGRQRSPRGGHGGDHRPSQRE